MGLNDYLGLLVEVDGATSINTVLLADVKGGVFLPIYSLVLWAKHLKTIVKEAPANPKTRFSPISTTTPSRKGTSAPISAPRQLT